MKRPLLESEKNFIKCAVLMLICGITFMVLGQGTWGIVCITIAVLFVGITINMYIKGDGATGSKAAGEKNADVKTKPSNHKK